MVAMRHQPTTAHLKQKVDDLRERPQHVRERIALLVSGGITLVVFLGWFGALASSNTFALSPIDGSADSLANPLAKVQESKGAFSTLLGAAGASQGDETPAPAITILDSDTPKDQHTQNATDATVIHF